MSAYLVAVINHSQNPPIVEDVSIYSSPANGLTNVGTPTTYSDLAEVSTIGGNFHDDSILLRKYIGADYSHLKWTIPFLDKGINFWGSE